MDKDILKEYEEITDVTFDHEGAHLASTHVLQGGASNGRNTPLILKAENTDEELNKALEQITVTMSMEEYLRSFFHMWYDDAEMLVKLMGMETEYEYYEKMEDEDGMNYHEKYLQDKLDKVEILRSAEGKEFKDLSDEQLEVVKGHLVQFVKGVSKHQDEFKATIDKMDDSKEFSSTAKEVEKKVTEESSGSTVAKSSGDGDSIATNKEGDSITNEDKNLKVNKMTDKKTVDKSAEVIALEKAEARIAELEKAQAANVEKDGQLEKAAARIEALEKAEEARLEKAFKNMADSYSFCPSEEKEEFAKSMMALRDAEASVVVFGMFEKAQAALNAAVEEEAGFESDAEVNKDAGKDALTAMITAKYDKATV